MALSNRTWLLGVLGAALVSLACAIVGLFVARAHLLEASEWVQHTAEVELTIADCRIHVREAQADVADRRTLLAQARNDAERIRRMTVDNPGQQLRIEALMPRLRAFDGDAVEADRIDRDLRNLGLVEDALKVVRLAAFARATRVGWLVSATNATLTVILVTLILATLYRQSQALVQAQAELRREVGMLESIVNSMVDGIMAITPSRAFLHINRAARRLLGDDFPVDGFPTDWRSNIQCLYENGTEMKPEEGALARAIAGKSTDNLVYKTRQLKNPNDPGTWISATARPVRDSGGSVIAAVVALRDITEQKHQQDQLRALSMSDEMTQLHNRRGFLMLAEQHARVSTRHGTAFAIVFVDVNGLKAINDSLGHEAGDRTIRSLANVLREAFRESDIVARLGGDEFVALLANATPPLHETLMARLHAAIGKHNERDAPARCLSVSVGISFFDPARPTPLAELMSEADRLMYADKREQRRLGS